MNNWSSETWLAIICAAVALFLLGMVLYLPDAQCHGQCSAWMCNSDSDCGSTCRCWYGPQGVGHCG